MQLRLYQALGQVAPTRALAPSVRDLGLDEEEEHEEDEDVLAQMVELQEDEEAEEDRICIGTMGFTLSAAAKQHVEELFERRAFEENDVFKDVMSLILWTVDGTSELQRLGLVALE